jgi:hypothetical protein
MLAQAEEVIKQAVDQHGRVDGVVNCVGSIVLKSAHTTSDQDFDAVSWCCLHLPCQRPPPATAFEFKIVMRGQPPLQTSCGQFEQIKCDAAV